VAAVAVAAVALVVFAGAAHARCRGVAVPTSEELGARGPYAVGFRVLPLEDTSRPIPADGAFPGAPARSLPTAVWYPAAPGTSGQNAPLDSTAPFPLVLHAHALMDVNTGERYLTEHLASHGFVVAAPTFPRSHIGAPGGPTVRDLANQPGDLAFLIDRLPGELPGAIDAARVGASGLSLGATTVLLTAYDADLRDRRLRAVLPIAPPYSCAFTRRFYRDARPPLLLLQGTGDLMVDPAADSERVFRRARGNRRLVEIANGSHIGFVGFAVGMEQMPHYDTFGCDFLESVLAGDYTIPALPDERRAGITRAADACPVPCTTTPAGPALDAVRQEQITNVVATAFFRATLADDAGARCFLGRNLAAENADVTVASRRARP
jgi:dienelactone hydrolase